MSANTSPLFTLVPVIGMTVVNTVNGSRDNPPLPYGLLAAGGTFGTRIELITIRAVSATSAGMIRFFVDSGSGGARLWQEVPVTAITPTSTIAGFSAELVRTDGRPLLVLPSGYVLKVTTQNSETLVIMAHGGDF